MTVTDEAVLALLATGNMTCTEVGETMWGRRGKGRQSYARPAGKVLHRLKRLGKVVCTFDPARDRHTWKLA